MTQEQFDDFLNTTTLKVREIWEQLTGRRMDSDETDKLNDLLEGFFCCTKELPAACGLCGSILDNEGYCVDQTCPFTETLQSDADGWIGHPSPPEWARLALMQKRKS